MKPDTYREHLNDLQVEVEELRAKLAVQPKPPENGSISAKTADNRNDRTTGDLISRAAALDAVFNNAEHPDKAYEAIRHLPSAQPEIKNPCSECQEFDCYGCEFKKDFHGGSNEY